MTAKNVRIGCAAGFWGDTETAAGPLLSGGDLDYLVFDYLAEITMSIMVGSRLRRPDGGHAHDFVTRVMKACLPEVMARGVKVVTNAGGIHPHASRKALQELAESHILECGAQATGGMLTDWTLIDGDKVTRWELPGCGAFNFLLAHSLGGGGIASLRPDPQGKSYAQQLLAFEVPVPDALYARLTKGESP